MKGFISLKVKCVPVFISILYKAKYTVELFYVLKHGIGKEVFFLTLFTVCAQSHSANIFM